MGRSYAHRDMAVRVLVVDDHAPFRRAARAVVSEVPGFELVGEVADGETSIEAAETLRPDLVLMDISLPGISGVEATRRIRATLPSAVVLLLSTRDALEFVGEAASCGAAAYLPKSLLSPAHLSELWYAASR